MTDTRTVEEVLHQRTKLAIYGGNPWHKHYIGARGELRVARRYGTGGTWHTENAEDVCSATARCPGCDGRGTITVGENRIWSRRGASQTFPKEAGCKFCHSRGRVISWLSWREGTILHLATRIHEDRDFAAMPILADAMEEAGCTEEPMLRHLREDDHCRGCWVLELLRQKS